MRAFVRVCVFVCRWAMRYCNMGSGVTVCGCVGGFLGAVNGEGGL